MVLAGARGGGESPSLREGGGQGDRTVGSRPFSASVQLGSLSKMWGGKGLSSSILLGQLTQGSGVWGEGNWPSL